MYKKTNRFMIGSRRGPGNQGGGGAFDPKKPSNRTRKKTRSAILAEHKILVKKQAEQLRILKERQGSIVEKKARAALREAIIASAEEHKRSRLEAEFQKAKIRNEQLASKERNASGKEVVVVRRRDGRKTKLRDGLVGQKAKPAPRRHLRQRSVPC
jgi:hypothetical protein